MDTNNISVISQQQTMTSMDIASITYKNHSDVLRAIRKMEPAWVAEQKSKFALKFRISKLGNGATKKNPYYELTKTECLYIATKFNDEARAKLVLRWEELEKQRMYQQTVPQSETHTTMPADPRNLSRKQLLLMALEAEEENEKLHKQVDDLEADNYGLMIECHQQGQEILELQERTAYLNVIMADMTNVTISQIAQDYGQSAVSFNKLLNGLRIQRKVGEQWILYSDYLNRGYVQTRMVPIHHAGCPDSYKPMTVWTQIGRRFLYEQLKKHGVLPLVERNQIQTH